MFKNDVQMSKLGENVSTDRIPRFTNKTAAIDPNWDTTTPIPNACRWIPLEKLICLLEISHRRTSVCPTAKSDFFHGFLVTFLDWN